MKNDMWVRFFQWGLGIMDLNHGNSLSAHQTLPRPCNVGVSCTEMPFYCDGQTSKIISVSRCLLFGCYLKHYRSYKGMMEATCGSPSTTEKYPTVPNLEQALT